MSFKVWLEQQSNPSLHIQSKWAIWRKNYDQALRIGQWVELTLDDLDVPTQLKVLKCGNYLVYEMKAQHPIESNISLTEIQQIIKTHSSQLPINISKIYKETAYILSSYFTFIKFIENEYHANDIEQADIYLLWSSDGNYRNSKSIDEKIYPSPNYTNFWGNLNCNEEDDNWDEDDDNGWDNDDDSPDNSPTPTPPSSGKKITKKPYGIAV